MQKIASLSPDEQDAIAAQILETLQDEDASKQKLAARLDTVRALAREALSEHQSGKTRPLDELL